MDVFFDVAVWSGAGLASLTPGKAVWHALQRSALTLCWGQLLWEHHFVANSEAMFVTNANCRMFRCGLNYVWCLAATESIQKICMPVCQCIFYLKHLWSTEWEHYLFKIFAVNDWTFRKSPIMFNIKSKKWRITCTYDACIKRRHNFKLIYLWRNPTWHILLALNKRFFTS